MKTQQTFEEYLRKNNLSGNTLDAMKDFFVRECIVQGVAKKVFKMRNIE